MQTVSARATLSAPGQVSRNWRHKARPDGRDSARHHRESRYRSLNRETRETPGICSVFHQRGGEGLAAIAIGDAPATPAPAICSLFVPIG